MKRNGEWEGIEIAIFILLLIFCFPIGLIYFIYKMFSFERRQRRKIKNKEFCNRHKFFLKFIFIAYVVILLSMIIIGYLL